MLTQKILPMNNLYKIKQFLSLKNVLRFLVLSYLVYSAICVILVGGFTKLNPTYKDCGIVLSKSLDEIAIKHGTKTQLYLNIKFEKSGFMSMECSPTEYFSTSVGHRKCYDLPAQQSGFYLITKLVGCLVIYFVLSFAVIFFIIYLFKQ